MITLEIRSEGVVRKDLGLGSCPLCGCNNVTGYVRAPDRFHLRRKVYQLLRCSSCSLVWLDDPPTPEEMAYHYGPNYHNHITASGELELAKRWRTPRDRVLEMARGGALLDIGCSSGAFLNTLKGNTWRLSGIEISPEEARRAEASSGAHVFVGEILDAPFPPESFDVITCFHVLEHVYKPKEVIRRVWEWLKPGGIFYILLPNIEALEAYVFRSFWYPLELPRHLWHFSPASLRRLFAGADFEELMLCTRPDCYAEKSVRYVLDDLFIKLGGSRAPLASACGKSSMLRRALRKALRLGVLWPFRRLAVAAGHGAAIEAIFRKKGSEDTPSNQDGPTAENI